MSTPTNYYWGYPPLNWPPSPPQVCPCCGRPWFIGWGYPVYPQQPEITYNKDTADAAG
jgi:hypothetical protein